MGKEREKQRLIDIQRHRYDQRQNHTCEGRTKDKFSRKEYISV